MGWRDVVFWGVCLPVRSLVAWFAIDPRFDAQRLVVASFATYVAAGLWAQATVVRPERGGFGGRVWWERERWAHASLWSMAAVLSFATPSPVAGGPLLVDVLVAAGAKAVRSLAS